MRRVLGGLATCCALLVAGGAGAAGTAIPVSVHDHTGIRLTDIVWTGSHFLYVENTTNTIWSPGSPPTTFATMPRVVEETRCRPSPAGHGWPAGILFCHSPDNVIYRIDASGAVSVFARLPVTRISDGALAFDTVGTFGFRLLAATGRSGNKSPGGGLFAITPSAAVKRIGGYKSPTLGGADELVQAPARFGSIGGWMVLTVDAGSRGALMAMDARGRTRVIAQLGDGPNPIAVVPRNPAASEPPVPRGLYVTDTNSTNVFFVPESALRPYAGDLVVGSELKALFWVVAPQGAKFKTTRIPLTLPGSNFNLEGAAFVS